MTGPVVVVASVTHAFADVTVVDDVTFDVAPGELVALAGRSGSGKTTLLHLVAGVGRPTRGRITVLGREATEVHDWATVSLTPQHSAVADGLTVRENVALAAALRGVDVDEALLGTLGLAAIADRPGLDTSLGEQQRTAIARGLVLTPRLALLDEPTSHQDDDHVDLVLAALQTARDAGSAVLVATHDPRVMEIADRVTHLAGGRVVTA